VGCGRLRHRTGKQEKVLQLEQYLSFDGSYCIDFESRDELRYNFGPTYPQLMISMYLPAVDDFDV
jgi:hypothetical protein